MTRYQLVVIGASWGGMHAISSLLEGLREHGEIVIAIAQHRHPDSGRELREAFQARTPLRVHDAEDKDVLEPGNVYLAPPDYHLLVERDGTLALSTDERVNFARPSIDVLFESAADAYGERCIGIVLTGANEDGAAGLRRIKERGGVAIIQDPAQALRRAMPDAAIAATVADAVLPLEEIGKFLYGLCVAAAGVREETRA